MNESGPERDPALRSEAAALAAAAVAAGLLAGVFIASAADARLLDGLLKFRREGDEVERLGLVVLVPWRRCWWSRWRRMLGNCAARQLTERVRSLNGRPRAVPSQRRPMRSDLSRLSPRLSLGAATTGVLALWPPYVALNTIFPGPALTYALGGTIALTALALLVLAGLRAEELLVRVALPSREGGLALAALAAILPLAVVAGQGERWDWLEAFVAAPASGIAQELYFRAALLATLERLSTGRPGVAVSGQALLFALWHLRAFRVVWWPQALVVLLGAFVAAWIWGWQVRRDRTVTYAAAQHAIFLAVL